MIKRCVVLSLFVLAACETTYDLPSASSAVTLPEQEADTGPIRSLADGRRAYDRVARRVEPIAEQVCREEVPNADAQFCDFQIRVTEGEPPNAFQTIGEDGYPYLVFNTAMLQTVRNDNEIAFILSHEAGHQIAGHLARRQRQVALGSILGAVLGAAIGGEGAVQDSANLGGAIAARAYSQDYELEADVIGTFIAERAGYDPVAGAQSFARFGGSDSLLSTHPPGVDRYRVVVATANHIAEQRARGEIPNLRRN